MTSPQRAARAREMRRTPEILGPKTHGLEPVPYLLNESGSPLESRQLAFAHRGFSPEGDENTMPAFRRAVDLGFRYLELDVRTSKDGVLYVFHDETLDRVTNGKGQISQLTSQQISDIRVAGTAPIPTFEELLNEWDDIHLNVDIKDHAGAELFAQHVLDANATHRVLAASFSDARRRRTLKASNEALASSSGMATTVLSTAFGAIGAHRLLKLRERGIVALQVPPQYFGVPVVTPAFVRHAHEAGLQVHVWVVDERSEMERLLDLGVDGIMTDRADVLAQVMDERGHWPQ
ncbi:glycerophosphodiester phosphodiesterase [Neomicrococcus lactis]|uniref:Glycerophosphoryl diester phosphodiesterase n=1 Tax=Neomicrococcus lactis TaxID=732241 RepID=A0A7W8YC36_9MICC|nr:glycerophosphoryl diester phosphodiesterase [Neomicrococcus lactis]